MAEIPQKRDLLTWSTENFIRKVKQFVRKYCITWLIDLANKLYIHYVEKFIDFILCHVLLDIALFFFLRNFTNKYKIQFNSFYINMWLSSLNIFEENQFYEIKKRNI